MAKWGFQPIFSPKMALPSLYNADFHAPVGAKGLDAIALLAKLS
jgi:hypothetical protein